MNGSGSPSRTGSNAPARWPGPMACPYPQGDPNEWCAWHQHAEELIQAMEARKASEAIRVLPGARVAVTAQR